MDRKNIYYNRYENNSLTARYICYLFLLCAFITWPNLANTESCEDLMDDLILISRCKTQAQCIEATEKYVKDTTEGCANMRDYNYETICGEMSIPKDFDTAFFTKVEQNLTGREKCKTNLQDKFKDIYTKQCINQVNQVNQVNILLCRKNGTKSQPGCDDWCAKQAEEEANNIYSKVKPENIATVYFESTMDGHSGTQSDTLQPAILVYHEMQGHPPLIGNKPIEKVNAQFDGSGVLTAEAKADGLRGECKNDSNMNCEVELEQALEEAVNTCSELRNEALKCCHEPEKCVGGGFARTLGSLGKGYTMIQGMKGREEACEAIQATHGMYGGMQGTMAAQCTSKADSCSQKCGDEVEKVVTAFKNACDYDPRTNQKYNAEEHICDENLFTKYVKQYKTGYSKDGEQIKIGAVPKQCERTGKEANRRIYDMSTNLGTSLLAGMKACGHNTPTPEPPPTAGCPPYCGTTSTTDGGPGFQPPPPPLAGEVRGGGGPKKNPKDPFSDPTPEMPANPFDQDMPDMGEPAPTPGKGSKGMGGLISSASSGGGGGSSLGGGGGSGGGGGGGQPAGGRPSAVKKNKILMGYHGGKFAGYGGGNSARSKRAGRSSGSDRKGKNAGKRGLAKLNLKKLLPKQGKFMNHKIGKFGSPHDDIFKRMSDRIQWMCRTGKIPCQ